MIAAADLRLVRPHARPHAPVADPKGSRVSARSTRFAACRNRRGGGKVELVAAAAAMAAPVFHHPREPHHNTDMRHMALQIMTSNADVPEVWMCHSHRTAPPGGILHWSSVH